MEKKKSIIVWDQFEQPKKEETTGATQDEIPTPPRNDEGNVRRFSQVKFNLKPFKHIFIAIFSAVMIGSMLGFLMLNLLTAINQPKNKHGLNQHAVGHSSEAKENHVKTLNEDQQFSLQEMAAYVVQVGVFHQKENAETWRQTYESVGIFTTIWERDLQYFLFAGLSEQKEEAQVFQALIKAEGLDAFIKEWHTEELEIQLSEEEYNWIKSFQQLWHESVQFSGKKEKVDYKKWTALIEHEEEQLFYAKELQAKMAQRLKDDLVKNNHLLEQQFLLEIWHDYASIYDL